MHTANKRWPEVIIRFDSFLRVLKTHQSNQNIWDRHRNGQEWATEHFGLKKRRKHCLRKLKYEVNSTWTGKKKHEVPLGYSEFTDIYTIGRHFLPCSPLQAES